MAKRKARIVFIATDTYGCTEAYETRPELRRGLWRMKGDPRHGLFLSDHAAHALVGELPAKGQCVEVKCTVTRQFSK